MNIDPQGGQSAKPHYLILDGLRGVAAIIVVLFHLAEALASGPMDILVNHGYLAVDFFFLLSGFVIGYAYDERWHKISFGNFMLRRMERLQPMVVLGMTLGAIGFYYTDSTIWPLIHEVPVWKMLLVLFIGYTILPVPLSLDIRGWQEMHPLNSVGWSLLFEYIANILYAIGIRKLSNKALGILVFVAAVALAHLAIGRGDVIGGWTLNSEHMYIGFTRVMYPFFAGLLLSRITKPTRIHHALTWCSLLVAIALFMPRIGGTEHIWMNGLYESLCIIVLFPLIVYLGASGFIHSETERKICKFLGDISYPLYLVHFPILYVYIAWLSDHDGLTIRKVWPISLLILLGSIALAYAALKWYDEPVRKWLRRQFKAESTHQNSISDSGIKN